MSFRFRFRPPMLGLAAASTLMISAPAFAATTVYTTEAAFLAAVAPGSYTESFSGSAETAVSFSFIGGGFGYTVTAPQLGFGDDVYRSGDVIGNFYSATSLTVTFTAGGPTAIGSNFYISDMSDMFVLSAPVTVTLSDGTTTTFVPTSSTTDSYRGFISTVPISSLTLSEPGSDRYNNFDNLTVGRVAAVPEPGTYALMAGGLVALAGVARRRRA